MMNTKTTDSGWDPKRQPNSNCHHPHTSGAHHHHHEAEQFIERALLYSDSRRFANKKGVPSEQIVAGVSCAMKKVAGKLAVDSILLGHIKAFLSFDSGPNWTFSVTRADHVDFSVLSDKMDSQNKTGFQVTADILSLTVPKNFSNGELEQFWRQIEEICL